MECEWCSSRHSTLFMAVQTNKLCHSEIGSITKSNSFASLKGTRDAVIDSLVERVNKNVMNLVLYKVCERICYPVFVIYYGCVMFGLQLIKTFVLLVCTSKVLTSTEAQTHTLENESTSFYIPIGSNSKTKDSQVKAKYRSPRTSHKETIVTFGTACDLMPICRE
jgi:hypothetical protein